MLCVYNQYADPGEPTVAVSLHCNLKACCVCLYNVHSCGLRHRLLMWVDIDVSEE